MRLLILSNGHGEDAVAVAIARHLPAAWSLSALPLVGVGQAYEALGCPILGPRQALPSGGFVWRRPQAWWGDLRSGYLGDMRARWRAAQAWVAEGEGALLSVGDVLPLLWAWRLRRPFAHLDVAKSDRYRGGLPTQFSAPERWLLRRPLARATCFRDPLTAQNLRALGLPGAECLGNPMADELAGLQPHEGPGGPLLILPGSRLPEAQSHLARWLRLAESLAGRGVGPFRLAVAPGFPWLEALPPGWGAEGEALLGPQGLRVAVGGLRAMAEGAALALASAGTATEQATGMGLPAVLLPGAGPQFTWAFAEAQSGLLAGAVRLCATEAEALAAAEAWWQDPVARGEAGATGRRLMGEAGAGLRLARAVQAALGPPLG